MRLIPTKKDIAFVEYLDEGSATIAKDALHNYKLDGEHKIKVRAGVFYHTVKLIFRYRLRSLANDTPDCLFAVTAL